LVLVVATVGVVPWQLTAAEPDENSPLGKLVAADDFWQRTGKLQEHPELDSRTVNEVRELAGRAANPVARVRAYKLLADLRGRTRVADVLPAAEVSDVVEGVFRYMETHLAEAEIGKFRPELGFTHVSVQRIA